MEERVIILKKHKGFGDTVAAVTAAIGIEKTENCGCAERQEAWNNPDLLINKLFYGTKQDIEVLREQSESGGEEA